MTTKKGVRLPLVSNLEEARFECVFPKCGGICCKNGRPPVSEGEAERIDRHMKRFVPHMRPEAVAHVEKHGWLTNRVKAGRRSMAVQGGWCVFHNEGCVLHKVGLTEGDFAKYKPSVCALFPLDGGSDGQWEVRQWGRPGEEWDLFCLDPEESKKKAKDTLKGELAFLERIESGKEKWRKRPT